jgi:hypothetical protein
MSTIFVLTHVEYPEYDQTEIVLDGLYSDLATAETHINVENEFGFTYYLYTMRMDAVPAHLSKSAGLFNSKADTNMILVKTYPSEKLLQAYPQPNGDRLRQQMTQSNVL